MGTRWGAGGMLIGFLCFLTIGCVQDTISPNVSTQTSHVSPGCVVGTACGGIYYRPTGGVAAEYDLSRAAGGVVPDMSGNGNAGTLQNGPINVAGGLQFDRRMQQRIALPAGVYAKTIRAIAVCYDATENLTDPSPGTEPVVGSDSPDGAFLSGSDRVGHTTRVAYGWRGQLTETSQQTYGPTCVGWTGGSSLASPDVLTINGVPATSFLPGGGATPNETQNDLLCDQGCNYPNPPLVNQGNPYIGYTNQVQNELSNQYPAYFSGVIYHVLYYTVTPTQAEMTSTLLAMQTDLSSKGVVFNGTPTSTAPLVVVAGDSRVDEATVANGSTNAWLPQIPAANVPWQRVNEGVSGAVCEEVAAGAAGGAVPLYSKAAPIHVAVWLCGVNSYIALGDTAQQVLASFDQWNATMRAAGFKTIVITEPYRDGTSILGPTAGATYDSVRQAINAGYKARAAQVDAIVDVGGATEMGTAASFTPRMVANVVATSIDHGVATLVGTNTFEPGDVIGVSGLSANACLNSLQYTVLASGLSGSQFQVATSCANAPLVSDSGSASTYTLDGTHFSPAGNNVLAAMLSAAIKAISPASAR